MDTALDSRLAARLAALRAERGWSLDQLSQRAGIPRATLSRLERGETSPTAALLGRLCTAYGRTMSRLLAEVEAVACVLILECQLQVPTLIWQNKCNMKNVHFLKKNF